MFDVSVLFNEPKLLKATQRTAGSFSSLVSVLFNEPKLLKSDGRAGVLPSVRRFSALQRAEIAESKTFSAEFLCGEGFSALQRAEIAEMRTRAVWSRRCATVSVLFNEPKLLKAGGITLLFEGEDVSVLFNEPKLLKLRPGRQYLMQR